MTREDALVRCYQKPFSSGPGPGPGWERPTRVVSSDPSKTAETAMTINFWNWREARTERNPTRPVRISRQCRCFENSDRTEARNALFHPYVRYIVRPSDAFLLPNNYKSQLKTRMIPSTREYTRTKRNSPSNNL